MSEAPATIRETEPLFLGAAEVARKLKVSPRYVRKLWHTGQLKFILHGRVRVCLPHHLAEYFALLEAAKYDL